MSWSISKTKGARKLMRNAEKNGKWSKMMKQRLENKKKFSKISKLLLQTNRAVRQK